MFCDKCGVQLSDTQQFCHSCGKSFAPARSAATPGQSGRNAYFRGRVARHASTLGVLWIVYSCLKLIPAFGAVAVGSIAWPFFHDMHTPFFVGPLLAGIGGVVGLVSIAGIAAGTCVMNYQSWARICLLVLAFLSLLSFPFGTAIGIYTIWVLLPGESDAELSRLAHSR